MAITYNPYYRAKNKKVVIQLISDRKVIKTIATGISLETTQWDSVNKKVINHPNQKLLNQKLQNEVNKLQADFLKADLLGVRLTQDRIKSIAAGNSVTTNFYAHCEPWIKEKYVNEGTQRAMLSDLAKLKMFSPTLAFGDVDAKFLTRYYNYMVKVLKHKGNTPWKSLKFIRTMLYDAADLAPINPFKDRSFKMPRYVQTHKDGLYISECKKLEEIFNEDVPVMYKIVTAKFLFMCYSGLRISDAKLFDTGIHVENDERLMMVTKKEGVHLNLKLYPKLKWILEVMASLPKKKLSDQYLNEWLKEIANYKNLTRINLTNHAARHTFGCILAESGVRLEHAQKLMAHKSIESTKIYYKLRQKTVDNATDLIRFDTE